MLYLVSGYVSFGSCTCISGHAAIAGYADGMEDARYREIRDLKIQEQTNDIIVLDAGNYAIRILHRIAGQQLISSPIDRIIELIQS